MVVVVVVGDGADVVVDEVLLEVLVVGGAAVDAASLGLLALGGTEVDDVALELTVLAAVVHDAPITAASTTKPERMTKRRFRNCKQRIIGT